MNPTPTPGARVLPLAALVLALLALLHALVFFAFSVEQPLIDQHVFRQSQTALTARWLGITGFRLDYETPVLGHPWAVPFEFPLYQWLVAQLSALSGWPIVPVGRALSAAFTFACLVPLAGMLRLVQAPPLALPLAVVMFLGAAQHLYWGRTVMIETAALALTLGWLWAALGFALGRPWGWLGAAIVTGVLAMLQKSTTAAVPALVILLGAGVLGWRAWAAGAAGGGTPEVPRRSSWTRVMALAAAALVPLVVGLAWARHTDLVKAAHPVASALTSQALAGWNFGSLAQKLDPEVWRGILETLFGTNLGGPVGAITLAVVAWCTRRERLARWIGVLALLGLLPPLVFTNLHAVHNYYATANVVYLGTALALALAWMLGRPRWRIAGAVTTLVIIGWNAERFAGQYRDVALLAGHERLQIPWVLGDAIRAHTPPGEPLLVYGFDWSSIIAWHGERRTFTVPQWFDAVDDTWRNPGKYLGGARPGGVVICPGRRSPAPDDVERALQRLGDYARTAVFRCTLLYRRA